MNIYEKILKAREQFLQAKVKKSGKNKFQNFEYFELGDIVPTIITICSELQILPIFNITASSAALKVVDVENPEEMVTFTSLIPELGTENVNMAIQNIGKIQTYQRRYLYMQFLDIVEQDTVDAGEPAKAKKSTPKPAPKKPRRTIKGTSYANPEDFGKDIPKAPAPPKNPNIKEKKGGKPSGAKLPPKTEPETMDMTGGESSFDAAASKNPTLKALIHALKTDNKVVNTGNIVALAKDRQKEGIINKIQLKKVQKDLGVLAD